MVFFYLQIVMAVFKKQQWHLTGNALCDSVTSVQFLQYIGVIQCYIVSIFRTKVTQIFLSLLKKDLLANLAQGRNVFLAPFLQLYNQHGRKLHTTHFLQCHIHKYL